MLITSAQAQVAGGAASGTSFVTFIPFILIFAIMYFLIIRPQRVQMKKRQEMLNSVRRGDVVVTGGGIIGKVIKVHDEIGELEVEIGENMRIRILRSTLADVRVKGEPVSEEKAKPSANKVKTPKKSGDKITIKNNVAVAKKAKSASEEEKPKA
ncbi:preprotein translocase subunit YajC [Bartonella bacilliformis]|uniref:Sec translocon accessory complex subunit YajC n=1 Tax=Bartonella bacilliformis Ver097 TaxID=1293911 RepID=A0A072R2N5_BARBA|nr:preprotein translocase subunit YajC [Bartonella bacilliformis]KEG20035.1 preprotein translocase, YajC subunit [Bartonella bacilliformis Ver097]